MGVRHVLADREETLRRDRPFPREQSRAAMATALGTIKKNAMQVNGLSAAEVAKRRT